MLALGCPPQHSVSVPHNGQTQRTQVIGLPSPPKCSLGTTVAKWGVSCARKTISTLKCVLDGSLEARMARVSLYRAGDCVPAPLHILDREVAPSNEQHDLIWLYRLTPEGLILRVPSG